MLQITETFKMVQEKYEIAEVAKNLGIRLNKNRANSIDNSGRGENAFAVYPASNTWYDFMLKIGGDVTDLVAYMKYDGDKVAALRELMPEWTSEKVKIQLSLYKKFIENIERWHVSIFDSTKKSSVKALEYLHSRGITDETIKALKIGIDPSGGNFRISFPYWDKAGKKILYYISRRFDWSGNGENEKEPKYKKASLDTYPFLENSILGLNSLDRGKDELVITEGMMDWIAFFQAGYSVISPNGGDFGKLWDEVLEIISNFKYVVLAFDSDEAGQAFTYKTAEMLLKHRVPFKVIPLPLVKDVAEFCEHGGKIETLTDSARDGLKWFIDYIRPKKLFEDLTQGEKDKALFKCKEFVKNICAFTDSAEIHEILLSLRQYFPKEWLSEVFKMAKKGRTQDEVKEKLNKMYNLLYNEKTGFYEYTDKGIWEARDDTTIQGYIAKEYGIHATGSKLSSTLKLVKACEDINDIAPIKLFNSFPCVSFLNGTLHIDMKTGETVLKPHSITDYVTVRLPYFYDPNAKCVNWRNFISDVTNGRNDRQKLLQEFAGYTLSPSCKFQKALMLKGGGSNGKSVFTNIISTVLGGYGDDGYISSVEPSRFGKDFRLMPFKNSWLNISVDTENDLRGAEGVFKRIVAGEVLEDSYKHRNPLQFKTRTKLMMCCNEFPTVKDTSDGFMRRWLIVNFPMHFVPKNQIINPNDRELDPNLEEKLRQELSGIFNWVLEGLQRLIAQNGFTETEEHNKLLKDFRRANNPLYAFAEDYERNFYEDDGEGKELSRHQIFLAYRTWADTHLEIPIGATRFYSNMQGILACLGILFEEKGRKWKFYSRK